MEPAGQALLWLGRRVGSCIVPAASRGGQLMNRVPELLVLRHGESRWNREGRMQGRLDSDLTAKGEAQARAMSSLLESLGVGQGSHDLLCSPQGRARRTAELALSPLGLAARPDARLREISVGLWSGLLREEIDRRWPPVPGESFLQAYARAPEGESFETLWLRVGALLQELERPAVLVTHGITSRFLRTRAMGWGMDRLEDLPGGQGVVHRLREGRHETLAPEGAAG